MVAKPSNGRFKIPISVEIDEEGGIYCSMNFGSMYDELVDECDERLIRATGCDDLDAFRSSDKLKRALIAELLRVRIQGALAGFAMNQADLRAYEALPIMVRREGHSTMTHARALIETFLASANEGRHPSVMTNCVPPKELMELIQKAEDDHAE